MISIIAFIIVMFGSLNWLCIGFFQYDLVAGLFGYQGSIFSRIVYIIVGICAVYLIYVMIKNKGRLTVKKLKKEEQPMVDKIMKKPEEQIEHDERIAQQVIQDSENHNTSQVQQTHMTQDNQTNASNLQTNYQTQVEPNTQANAQANQTYIQNSNGHIVTSPDVSQTKMQTEDIQNTNTQPMQQGDNITNN